MVKPTMVIQGSKISAPDDSWEVRVPDGARETYAHVSVTIDGLTIHVGRSPKDGVFVVEIEGPGDKDLDPDGSPRLRLYFNEENTYENPPFPDET